MTGQNRRRIKSPATGDSSFSNRVCETDELFVDFIEIQSSVPVKKHEAGRYHCMALPLALCSTQGDRQPRYRRPYVFVDGTHCLCCRADFFLSDAPGNSVTSKSTVRLAFMRFSLNGLSDGLVFRAKKLRTRVASHVCGVLDGPDSRAS